MLTFGKTANAILQAPLKEWQPLRDMWHRGPVIEHYCWDRAGLTALERNVRQWYTQRPVPLHLASDELPAYIIALTQFIVVTPCAVHDAHNAFRWGFLDEVKDRDLMRDAYVSVESIRNSNDLIAKHMGTWVSLRLTTAERMGVDWQDERSRVLNALGVDMETMDIMLCLELRWEGGRLMVAQDQPYGDLVGTVVLALTATWRFRKWTESRWLSVGLCSRAVVSGLLLGLPDLVHYIINDTKSSLYYIKGYNRLTDESKQFMVRACLASRVSEGSRRS